MNKRKLLYLLYTLVTLLYSLVCLSTEPKDVFEFQINKLIPIVAKLANIKNLEIPYKKARNSNLKPVDVYILLSMNYNKLKIKFNLNEIKFKQVDNLLPSDVYNLSEEVVVNLSRYVSTYSLSDENLNNYKKWKKNYRNGGNSIVPGDVFFLNVYLSYLIREL